MCDAGRGARLHSGSDEVFLVVVASDPGAAVMVNDIKTRVGSKVTQDRLPPQDLVVGSNFMTVKVTVRSPPCFSPFHFLLPLCMR
jgi:predicted RNA-binding protein with EMAP domain